MKCHMIRGTLHVHAIITCVSGRDVDVRENLIIWREPGMVLITIVT